METYSQVKCWLYLFPFPGHPALIPLFIRPPYDELVCTTMLKSQGGSKFHTVASLFKSLLSGFCYQLSLLLLQVLDTVMRSMLKRLDVFVRLTESKAPL